MSGKSGMWARVVWCLGEPSSIPRGMGATVILNDCLDIFIIFDLYIIFNMIIATESYGVDRLTRDAHSSCCTVFQVDCRL